MIDDLNREWFADRPRQKRVRPALWAVDRIVLCFELAPLGVDADGLTADTHDLGRRTRVERPAAVDVERVADEFEPLQRPSRRAHAAHRDGDATSTHCGTQSKLESPLVHGRPVCGVIRSLSRKRWQSRRAPNERLTNHAEVNPVARRQEPVVSIINPER